MTRDTIPSISDLYNPTLEALHKLGGISTTQEINTEVITMLNLTDEQLEAQANSGGSVVHTRLGNAKTNLKRYGLLENPRVGVWALTEAGQNTRTVDPRDVRRVVQEQRAKRQIEKSDVPPIKDDAPMLSGEALDADDIIASLLGWRDELSSRLHGMPPAAFERFFLHIFHSEGIGKVDVTGRSGDDAIEGMMESGGFLSLRVSFRCIRGSGLISTGDVHNFRREVTMGRANKGLLVTTGKFTQEARREAARGGAPEIDLIDGEQLMDKLKELSLGVKTERVVVERVMIDADWFQNI